MAKKKDTVKSKDVSVKAVGDDSQFAHLKDPANPEYNLAKYNTLMTAAITVADLHD